MLNEWVKKNRKQGKRKGITLVEVLVVIVILAVLTVSLSAKIGSYFDKPKELKVLNDMSYVRDAVILANGTNGLKTYGTIADADTMTETAKASKLAKDLNSVLDPSLKITATATGELEMAATAKDPWNKPYKIGFVGAGAGGGTGDLIGITITSYGADGTAAVAPATDPKDDYIMKISLNSSTGVLEVNYGNLPGQ